MAHRNCLCLTASERTPLPGRGLIRRPGRHRILRAAGVPRHAVIPRIGTRARILRALRVTLGVAMVATVAAVGVGSPAARTATPGVCPAVVTVPRAALTAVPEVAGVVSATVTPDLHACVHGDGHGLATWSYDGAHLGR